MKGGYQVISRSLSLTKIYYDFTRGNGLLYDNVNVFFGGFDDKKQKEKHKNK